MAKLYLSVVIPCFDEMANLQKGVLEKVRSFLTKKGFGYEVIIVDDGSRDESVEFIENFVGKNSGFRLLKSSHTGKAGAVTKGMLEATAELVLFADMDQATPIEELDKLLPYFDEGYDVVIGSRNNRRKGSPFIRVFISRANMILRRLVVGIADITDTQCGFKMFRREASDRIFSKVNDIHHGYRKISGSSVTSGFDVEILYLAEKMGFKIKEVPVKWLYVETRRVNPVKDSYEGVMELLKIKQNALKGIYSV